jgi:hypothetical protein
VLAGVDLELTGSGLHSVPSSLEIGALDILGLFGSVALEIPTRLETLRTHGQRIGSEFQCINFR